MPRDDLTLSEVLKNGREAIRSGANPAQWYAMAMGALKNACEAKDIDIALNLEILIYQNFIKECESDETIGAFYKDAAHLLEGIAERVEPARGNEIGFILASGSYLGHTEILVSALKYRPATVFILGVASERLANALTDIGVKYFESGKERSHSNRIEWLYQEAKKRNVGTLVWVSGNALAHYAFAKRIAEKQIYWSLRYRGLNSKHVDGLITCFPNVKGWEFVPMPWPEKIKRGDEEQIKKLSNKLESYFIFGVICREEKMTPEYLGLVKRILSRCPGSAFLYTAVNPYPLVEQILGPVLSRVGDLGWVKIEDTLPVFDVFLDTFPLGGGITTIGAMDLGIPVVHMQGTFGPLLRAGGGCEDGFSYADHAEILYQSRVARDMRREHQSKLADKYHGVAREDSERLFKVINDVRHG
jgi:hypothetical protein